MKNYYAILEVPVGCSLEEIRQAYRRLAQEHLDDASAFAELKEAYEALTTPERRAEYDLTAWGETFGPSGADSAHVLSSPLGTAERAGRCPMGVEDQCPILLLHVAPADQFCPECGYLLTAIGSGSFDLSVQDEAPQARLEEVGGRMHPLVHGSNLAGRESAEVLLPDKTVSRQHARLELIEGVEATIEDLGSTNGTQVNDQTLIPHFPRHLADGDRIRFGSVLTTLHLPEPVSEQDLSGGSSGEEEILPVLPSPEPRAWLRETREAGPEDDAPREFALPPGLTTFGRRAENSVVLGGDPYVSGSHAQISAEGEEFQITDVGSTNGTLLNGQRLSAHETVKLSAGDLVIIGGTALRFEPVSADEIVGESTPEEAPVMPEEVPAMPDEPLAAAQADSAPVAQGEG